MKRKQHVKKEGNLIHFPNVEKKLLERGMECIEAKRYREAVPLLEEAIRLLPTTNDAHYALLLAYYETGQWQNAKKLADTMLKSGMGDYYQIMDLYLMILVETNEYEELKITLEALLDVNEIPIQKREHFRSLLNFSERMLDQSVEGYEMADGEEWNDQRDQRLLVSDLSTHESLSEQLRKVTLLRDQNIYPLLSQLKEILVSRDAHPFIQSLILNVMKEHGTNERIRISKLGKVSEVVPVELPDLQELPQDIQIKEALTKQLEQDNPTLLQSVFALINRHSLCLYPFEREPEQAIDYAAAYHMLALAYLGQDVQCASIAIIYGSREEVVDKAYALLLELEEISSVII